MHAVKTLADSLFVLCKLAYFDSTTAEQFIISPRNFVPILKTPVFYVISKFWLNLLDNKINAVETSHVCTLLIDGLPVCVLSYIFA